MKHHYAMIWQLALITLLINQHRQTFTASESLPAGNDTILAFNVNGCGSDMITGFLSASGVNKVYLPRL
jgi:uncharacterized membrane protein